MTEVTVVPPRPSFCRIVTAFGGDDLGTATGGLAASRGLSSGKEG